MFDKMLCSNQTSFLKIVEQEYNCVLWRMLHKIAQELKLHRNTHTIVCDTMTGGNTVYKGQKTLT